MDNERNNNAVRIGLVYYKPTKISLHVSACVCTLGRPITVSRYQSLGNFGLTMTFLLMSVQVLYSNS